ncbi:peptidylprolyl isomerase [Paracoccus aerodenitrificans]|uniref:peptidylprolyl isomerase n=1 Tax=Paracoccus aerodenitrificans TaxID=3017781 RepID=UPI0022F10D28|nr:peptidylprolyl isomerase [Paracoccus aerodenitrificans]WBU64229.1 peptidylprolyl isomerase [Paracoccus aerodenitrificans]
MFKLSASAIALLAALAAAPAFAQDDQSGSADQQDAATADQQAEAAEADTEAEAADAAENDAAAQSADPATVVATVNGKDITLGELAAMKLRLPPEMAGMPANELWDLMLDEVIRQTALAEFGEQDLSALDQAALVNLRRDYLTRSAMERIVDFEPTDEQIQAAYEEAFPAESPITEYNADHILVETEEAAASVIEELEGGADFAQLAQERSVDTGSAQSGGDLGWFTVDSMVPEFGNAVAGMEPGSTSAEPVQSQFGFHIIKLNETREMEPPALDEIREQLAQQVRRKKLEQEIERITSEATVERVEGLDPSLLDQNVLDEEE